MNDQKRTVLLKKYDVPTPRYTSYPTVPTWEPETFSEDKWRQSVHQCFEETNDTKGISLYIHLPFCESLCTFCACTTRITKNHSVEIRYIQAVLKEWNYYLKIFGRRPIIRELHLGGGTPTFFSQQNLRWLISYLLEEATLHDSFEFSFEGHPNNTTEGHLRTLFDLGFSRVSFGAQDLDEKVQRTIHRIQPFGNMERAVEQARKTGYKSISVDLVYGLPFQTPFTVSDTIHKILTLQPDRLSYYSYAHVPWIKPGQRGYDDTDLPSGYLKRHLYEIGKHALKKAGYVDIGMDHFALPTDGLFKAHVNKKLHRNFMGYTTNQTDLLIGLGASAISDSGYAYAQNKKQVEEYYQAVSDNDAALLRGHYLTAEDRLMKECILQISCQGRLDNALLEKVMDATILGSLEEMEKEGILYFMEDGLKVTSAGQPFIRNICRVFDKRMDKIDARKEIFSQSI